MRTPPAPTWKITAHDHPNPTALKRVDDGIGDYNDAVAPLHEVQHLSCIAWAPAGEVLGGAVGRTWGENAELLQLWLEESQRGKGLGAALLQQFEAKARTRGCTTFYLETFSFQAPDFYRKHGYQVAVCINGFGRDAAGHPIAKYTLIKRDAEPSSPSRNA